MQIKGVGVINSMETAGTHRLLLCKPVLRRRSWRTVGTPCALLLAHMSYTVVAGIGLGFVMFSRIFISSPLFFGASSFF